MKLTEIISDDAKAALHDAVTFLEGLPEELASDGAGAQVAANLKAAVESEVTAVAGPTISPILAPYASKWIDGAIADLKAQLAALESQKAALAPVVA